MSNRIGNVRNVAPSTNGKPHKRVVQVESPDPLPPFSNYSGDVPLAIDDIRKSLLALTDGWPKCISGVLCYATPDGVRPLQDTAELFAWIAGKTLIEWKRGSRAVSKEEFFKRLHQRKRWDWATPHPHFPPLPGVLYLADPPGAENTGKLDELIDRFCPKTWADRELIKALILTLFWGGPPGKRPQFAIVADESSDEFAGRGTGKTTLVQYLARLVGGCVDIDHSASHDRITSNLLSPSSWGARVVLLDNLKTSRFSSDFLEKLITRDEITGHRLYTGFATRPNLLTWIATVNGAYFSTDMAMRSVVIRLNRPPDTAEDWDAKTVRFMEKYRAEIVADVRWHLEELEPANLNRVDRWATWCLQVLSRCKRPNKLLSHICEQRDSIDADKTEMTLALDHLRGCIASHFSANGPSFALDTSVVWAPTAWFVQALRALKRDLTDRQAQQFMARLVSTKRFHKAPTKSQRGYCWVGAKVDLENLPVQRDILYRPEVPSQRQRG